MRPDWNTYFMEMAEMAKTRSTCKRRKVGAVIVKNKRLLSTGYNGAPSNTKHCLEIGCLREKMGIPSGERHELCRGIHAEQNAIIQAAFHGVSIEGSDLYATLQPCVLCAKMAINAGIKRIYFKGSYPDELSMDLLNEAKIELIRMD
ncbi:deoxycytidylate deaminase [Anaeromicrobium sediminis]|uniref:Cytidine deaminase n=1 Tax=Anaeromicrobium sediminis TaxID=1478221 RepID=A0A267MFR7_9FIRM|nr:cytidine/deoxycytidylate deaminase family protein [Anaeromicrobium sediminis]PAB58307.1 cytidine deaminase [Anaeromicrobium sediminis]